MAESEQVVMRKEGILGENMYFIRPDKYGATTSELIDWMEAEKTRLEIKRFPGYLAESSQGRGFTIYAHTRILVNSSEEIVSLLPAKPQTKFGQELEHCTLEECDRLLLTVTEQPRTDLDTSPLHAIGKRETEAYKQSRKKGKKSAQ